MTDVVKPGLLFVYFSRFVSNTGDWAYLVALTVILAKVNSLSLTLVWLIRSLVPLCVRVVAGTVADKWGYKRTAVCVDIVRGVVTGSMPWFLHSPVLFLLVFLVAGLSPLFTASLTPMCTELTTAENRHRVNSVLTTATAAGLFFGPMAGGLLLQIGWNYPFYFEGATFIVSAMLLALLNAGRAKVNVESRPMKPVQFWFDFRESTSFIFQVNTVRLITIAGSLFVLGGSAVDAYEVLFVTHALRLGSTSYALVVTVGGLSFIVGGILNSVISKWIKPPTLLNTSLVLGSLANLLLSLAWNIYPALLAAALIGIAMTTFNASSMTLLQNIVPMDKQAKVLTAQSVFPDGASIVSVVAAGACVPFIPIRTVFIVCAGITFLALIPAFISWRRRPDASGDVTESVQSLGN